MLENRMANNMVRVGAGVSIEAMALVMAHSGAPYSRPGLCGAARPTRRGDERLISKSAKWLTRPKPFRTLAVFETCKELYRANLPVLLLF
jgi:hypothetical protein